MSWRKIVELLKLCNTPATIISPFPLFALSLFLISHKVIYFNDFPVLFAGITVSMISNFGSNLWNHCNDLKEDTAQGKKTILTQDALMEKKAIYIAILLYIFSILFTYYLSVMLKKPIYLYFLPWAFVTWWYSDNYILKKVIGLRLKEHYLGELITYGIAWPMYTLSIWLIYSDLNVPGILITVAFLFFGISGLLLKDLKDISGDRKAGLKTFGVFFYPSQLIQYSSYFMLMYYVIMLNPFTLYNFNTGILVLMLPFIYFLKNTFIHMHRKNWILEAADVKALKGFGYSVYISVIFIGLGSLF